MQGYIVVITRNGSLGGRYPLTSTECLFGQSPMCDVRVYVQNVARKHCVITALPNNPAYLSNLSPLNTTLVNGSPIGSSQWQLGHRDIITVGDRHFQWEYPVSSRLALSTKPVQNVEESGGQGSSACMVQMPLSVLKNKRHSTPRIMKENKIISITSQEGGEPNPKRRKTVQNMSDLRVENKLMKPVNKQLLAVTQPASSPKSFNTFKVLLKSATKRKSMISKTPKPVKRVISSKVQRSKSLSPSKLLSKKPSTSLNISKGSASKRTSLSKTPRNSKTPLKGSKSSVKKSPSPFKNKTPKQTPKQKQSISPLKSKSPKNTPKTSKSPSKKSNSTLKRKTPKGTNSPDAKNKTPTLKRKSTLSTPLKRQKTPKLSKSPNVSSSKLSKSAASPSPRKSLSSSADKSKTPKDIFPKLKRTPVLQIYKLKSTPIKTPRGRLLKTPEMHGSLQKSLSPAKSKSPKSSRDSFPAKTPTKTPRGRTQKTSERKGSLQKHPTPTRSPTPKSSRKSSPVKTPAKTPRGRTPKTSERKGSLQKHPTPTRSPTPKSSRKSSPVKTPAKTPRSRTPKTSERKGSSQKHPTPTRFQTPKSSRKSSPVKTPAKTPRGRTPKISEREGSSQKHPTPTRSPTQKSSRKSSPVKTPAKTPRGRTQQSSEVQVSVEKFLSLAKVHLPNTSRNSSPAKKGPTPKTPSGRLLKSPEFEELLQLSLSPVFSFTPDTSHTGSLVKTPAKTPRGRTLAKTPRGRTPRYSEVKVSTRKSILSVKSQSPNTFLNSSPAKEEPIPKTPRSRSPKTAVVGQTSQKSLSPAKSQSPNKSRCSSPAKKEPISKTPRGKSPKTPEVGRTSQQSLSPAKSPSPNKSRSSSPAKKEPISKTPRGGPPKTPVVGQTSQKSLSPAKSQSPNKSRSSSPAKKEQIRKTPRGRPPRTPEVERTSQQSLSPARSSSPTNKEPISKTPRGRPPKTPEVGRNSQQSLSPAKSPSPNKSRSSSPAKNESISKTLRGRPPKTPEVGRTSQQSLSPAKSPSPNKSRSSSPAKKESISKTPRGRPPKTPEVGRTSQQSLSPAKSPSPNKSRSSSPAKKESISKTPRGRPPKTPEVGRTSQQSLSPAKSLSPNKSRSSSPAKKESVSITPRGRPPKIPQINESSQQSLAPALSFTPDTFSNISPEKTPAKSPRGRTPKTSEVKVSSQKSHSPAKSQSPVTSRNSSPAKKESIPNTPSGRGRPSKTPEIEESLSPAFSFTPDTSRNSSPVKTPPKTSRDSSLVKSETPVKTPINRSPKTPSMKNSSSMESLSFAQSPLLQSSQKGLPVRATRGRTPIQTSKVQSFLDQSSNFSSSSNANILSCVTPKAEVRPTRTSTMRESIHFDTPFPHRTLNIVAGVMGVAQLSDSVHKSARRSALRSGLSSSMSSASSVVNPLLKSSAKKVHVAELQGSSKRKNDFEAKAERAAKRLKMETPKSLSKNKVAALLVCHRRSPKSVPRKPLFSEVLKSRLSTAAQRQMPSTSAAVVVKKRAKQKPFEPALDVPKSFKFNSTGHANSPETIVITKKRQKTPAPKTRKGRKSKALLPPREGVEPNLEGVPQLFKTPFKTMAPSLKSASSVKKPSNVRVRFSLQNDVKSPSGKRSVVAHAESEIYLGSPIIKSKRYVGTPRPRRISESSLLHTSIGEELPNDIEFNTSHSSGSGSSRRKSKLSLNSFNNQSNKSFDFSAYSPSSPTLQFSQISGVSSVGARKSIDLSGFSPVSESNSASPKRKRCMPSLDESLIQTSSPKRFSLASSSKLKISEEKFQPSPDENARLSKSYLFGSTFEDSNVSLVSRASRSSNADSINTSGVFKFSPNSSQLSSKKASILSNMNVSQIPLPPSISKSRSRSGMTSSSSSPSPKSNESVISNRSTRSNKSVLNTPKTTDSIAQNRRSKSHTLTLDSKIVVSPKTSPSTQSATGGSVHSDVNSPENVSTSSVYESPEVTKRMSSTPILQLTSNTSSPVSSPILNSRSQSYVSQNVNISSYTFESLSKSTSIMFEDTQFKTPLLTSGRKARKGSARMSASNTVLHSSESPVPIAAVKPSTRKKQGNESMSSVAESVSLPNLSYSEDVSARSIDRNFDQMMLDSRVGSSYEQIDSQNSSSSAEQSNLSLSSSGRRKRKSSAPANLQTPDVTTFDFNSAVTPNVPREMFVSPLSKVQDDLTDVAGVKRVFNPHANSPLSSYVNVRGVKRLLKTPKASPVANYTNIEGIKDLFKQSPVADYTNVIGVKRLYGAPTEANYMNVKGVRRIFKDTNTPNTPEGVEFLFESPKKIVDEYNQPSTSKPVVMVSPMSRLSFGAEKEFGNPETDAAETVQHLPTTDVNSGSRSRQISALSVQLDTENEGNIPTSLRKTRRTNLEVVNKDDSPHQQLNNTKKPVKEKVKDNTEDSEPSRKGRSTRRNLQVDKSQISVSDQGPMEKPLLKTLESDKSVKTGNSKKRRPIKKGHEENKDKLNEMVKVEEQPANQTQRENKNTDKERSKRGSSSDQDVDGNLEQKITKRRKNADNLIAMNRSPQLNERTQSNQGQVMAEILVPIEKRKTRAKPGSPESRKNNSPTSALGKRKLVSDSATDHSPPKRGRRKQQPKVELQEVAISSSTLKQTSLKPDIKQGGQSIIDLVFDGVPNEIKPEPLLQTKSTRSRRGKNETFPKSPEEVKQLLSPAKSRSRLRKVIVEHASNEVAIVNESTSQPSKGEGNILIDIPLKTAAEESPVKSTRLRKDKVKIATPEQLEKVKPTGHSKKVQETETISKSVKETVKQTPLSSKQRGRRGHAVEQETSEGTVKSPAKTKKQLAGRSKRNQSQEVSKKSTNENQLITEIVEKIGKSSRKTAAMDEAIEVRTEQESEKTTRGRPKRGKTENTPPSKKSTKTKGKNNTKEESPTELEPLARINKRTKEDVVEESSTSQIGEAIEERTEQESEKTTRGRPKRGKTENTPSSKKSTKTKGKNNTKEESPTELEPLARINKRTKEDVVEESSTSQIGEAIEERTEQESKKTTRGRPRQGKTENLTVTSKRSQNTKGKNNTKEESSPELEPTARLDERIKTDAAEESTSQRNSRTRQQNLPAASKTSKKVQFNTSASESKKKVMPNKKAANVTFKTKAASKGKLAASKKSSSPVKSPPAKRVTRSRK